MSARNHTFTIGDTVTLKRDNPYGMDATPMLVTAVTYKPGYKTPWVHTALGAFRPSDFTR